MPRFHFRLTDGQRLIEDEDGLELPSCSAATRHAVAHSRELVLEGEALSFDWSGWRVEVEDDTGQLTLTAPVVELCRREIGR